jgi:hypothetical protein
MTRPQTMRQRRTLQRLVERWPRPDYREGPLDAMLIGAVAMCALGVIALGVWGGRC